MKQNKKVIIDTCHKCGSVTEVKVVLYMNSLTKKETKKLECSYCNEHLFNEGA